MDTRCRSRRAADAAALAVQPLSWDQVNTAALATLRRLFPVGADSGGYPVSPVAAAEGRDAGGPTTAPHGRGKMNYA